MSTMVKKVKLSVVVSFIITVAALAGWGSAASSWAKSSISPSIAPAVAAAAPPDLYGSNCAACHGADGSGNTPAGKKLGVRDLRSGEVQRLSDEQLHHVIALGKGKMPGFGKRLNDDQINELVKRVRQMR